MYGRRVCERLAFPRPGLKAHAPIPLPRGKRKDALRSSLDSVDTDVAGAGFNANSGTAAVDLPDDVMLRERALHSHFMVAVNVAGAGRRIERKAGAVGVEFHIAGAGGDAPALARLTVKLHIARAGLRLEAAIEVAQLNIA